MNERLYYSHKRLIIVSIILSLLFNISALIYLLYLQRMKVDTFIIPTNNDNYIIIQEPQERKNHIQKQEKEEEWVQTATKPSGFGNSIQPQFIEHEKEIEHPEIPYNQQEPPVAQDVTNDALITSSAIPVTLKELSQMIAETAPAKEKVKAQKNTLPQQKKHHSPLSKAPAVQSTFTLSNLAQGFLDSINQNGNHSINMLGEKSGVVSLQQSKHERYLEKLFWQLQNTCRINQDKIPPLMEPRPQVVILIHLNKDGTLRKLLITKSCGNPIIDNFVFFIFKEASSSFPPIPLGLPHDPYSISVLYTV